MSITLTSAGQNSRIRGAKPRSKPLPIAHLDAKALDAAKVINDDPDLIKKFCEHAYLKL